MDNVFLRRVYPTPAEACQSALNSDNVTYADFGESFKSEFEKHVIITFTDATLDGGVLEIRF